MPSSSRIARTLAAIGMVAVALAGCVATTTPEAGDPAQTPSVTQSVGESSGEFEAVTRIPEGWK